MLFGHLRKEDMIKWYPETSGMVLAICCENMDNACIMNLLTDRPICLIK